MINIHRTCRHAMDTCRPSWSTAFKVWLIDMVKLSIESAIGEYGGKFYKPKSGCPTGGSLSVQIANIAVFFVLLKALYSDKLLMKDIVDIKRFIDDGVGIHSMTSRSFSKWKKSISERVAFYGLTIKESDWNEPSVKHDMINFLDINFSFDGNRDLQTDLYRKPTDARAYLHFNSCHPPHSFAGSVKSQALRLRRIINNDGRLHVQLEELKRDFRKCEYPLRMLDNIIDPIKLQSRSLEKRKKNEDNDDRIRVISTYGRDDELVSIFKKAEKINNVVKFSFVKKTGPSLRNILTKPKRIALGEKHGFTKACQRRRCAACGLMSNKEKLKGPNRKTYHTKEGCCTTKNCIYHAECKLCEKPYCGKTTQRLAGRISGHRSKFKECRDPKGKQINFGDDDHLLGMHLVFHHGLTETDAFNTNYSFTVLEECCPKDLDRKEHEWVQKLQTVTPYGLNAHDPFGIPLVL